MNIKISNFLKKVFNRNKGILEQINKDEKIEKCCKNCKYKIRCGAFLNTYKCSLLNIIVKTEDKCDYHKISSEFIKFYKNNLKVKKANFIKKTIG